MLKTFSQQEMLSYWKRNLGLKASPRLSGETDLTELDRKLLDDIEAWYADLLLEAPAEKLPVADIADRVSTRYISDNSAEIILPENCVRLVSIKMEEWECDEVESYSAYSDTARLQRNRLTRATIDDPVVIRRPGRLEVHGLVPPPVIVEKSEESPGKVMAGFVPTVETLEMVIRPDEGVYILDNSLLRHSRLYIH